MELWEEYEKDSLIPNNLVLEKLVNDKEGLKVSLSDYHDKNNLVNIFFKHGAVAYRCVGEGEYLRTFSYINNTYGNELLGKCKIFKVQNSRFMKWVKEESMGLCDCESQKCEQYVVFTVNEVIEVITYNKPKIIT